MQPTDVRVDHALVGASDLDAAIAFYGALGLEPLRRHDLPAAAAAALYGIDGPAAEAVLGVPGADDGFLRVVAAPGAAPERGDFHRGGHALDLYSTDVAASVERARGLAAVVGPIADYRFGPVQLQQAQAMAPDDVPVVFVGIDHRLPSVLDAQPERLHSELHSVVASVDDLDAETAFWIDVVGVQLKSQFPIDVPAVSEFMMLPRHAPVRMSVMTGAEANPPRFELLQFTDAEGAYVPGRPLRPGCTWVGLRVGDLAATLERLVAAGATAGEPVEVPGLRDGTDLAVALTTPGGVDVEVRQGR